jgi:hypothetical protein
VLHPVGARPCPSGDLRSTDDVVVELDGGHYVIEDVLLLGDWSFKAGNSLKEVLEAR